MNFYILPKILRTIFEFSPEGTKEVKNKIFILTIFAAIFLFFFNFYFLSIERNLKEEEEKLKRILNTNPNDRLAKDKLDQIERKKEKLFWFGGNSFYNCSGNYNWFFSPISYSASL